MEHSVDKQVLQAVLGTLADRVQPSVTDAAVAAALGMSVQLLEFLQRADYPGVSAATRGDELVSWPTRMTRVAAEAKSLEQSMIALPLSAAKSQSIPVDLLQSYVRGRLPGASSARVSDLSPSLGGFSKETYIVSLADSPIEKIVIRRDPLAGPVERTAAEEFPILKAAFAHGVLVPEPLWADADAPFGRSIVVTRFAGGRSAFDLTGSTLGEDQAPAALALASTLAKVHSMPLPMQATALSVHVRTALDLLEDQWHRRRIWDSDVLQGAFAWMREHVPDSSSRPVVVHGDASLRNLLMDGDRASALLDWELWHVGDPVEDLAYCRPDVEQVLPWEEFMRQYHGEGGGGEWSETSAEYYGMWASLRNAVLCASCLHGFVSADLPEARMAYAGIIHYRRLLLDVAHRLASVKFTQ